MSKTAWNVMSLYFAVMIVWFILLGCGTFCNWRAMKLLREAKRLIDAEPFDEPAVVAQMARVDVWMRRDCYFLKAATLGWFKEPK